MAHPHLPEIQAGRLHHFNDSLGSLPVTKLRPETCPIGTKMAHDDKLLIQWEGRDG